MALQRNFENHQISEKTGQVFVIRSAKLVFSRLENIALRTAN